MFEDQDRRSCVSESWRVVCRVLGNRVARNEGREKGNWVLDSVEFLA